MSSGIIYTLDCHADSEHIFAALAVLYQAASATMTGTSGSNGPNWKYEADQINMFQTLTCRCSLFVDDPVFNNWCDRVHEEKVGPILSSSDAWQRTWWRPCLVFLGLFTRRFLLRHLILIELHCLQSTQNFCCDNPILREYQQTVNTDRTNIIAMSTYRFSTRLLSAELIKNVMRVKSTF